MADLPPGVPPLPAGAADGFLSPDQFLEADTVSGYGTGSPPLWGLFIGARPVVICDTVLAVDYKQDWAIADYPVERGGFESYDKVNTPYAMRMTFVSGGSEAKRQALLDSVAGISDTLTLLNAVTPEATYIGVNIGHYSYRRTAQNGLGLMIVNVGVIEIREEGVTDFKNAKEPGGYAASQAGNVQAQTPSDAVSGAVAAGDRAEAP